MSANPHEKGASAMTGEHVVGRSVTPPELAWSMSARGSELSVGEAQAILVDFQARGIVEAVDPSRFALTEQGRAVALAFVGAAEEVGT